MSLFQRIKTPFSELAEDDVARPERHAHAVGELLRERREELGLELDAVGAALCIKPVFLAALEQGRTQDLPGPAYAIGFIRAYAHYLGFDAGRILDSYKAESADVHVRPDLSLPVPLGERSVPGGPILLVALILALCGYGTWYYLSTGERSRPERVAALPAELQQLPPAAHRSPAATPTAAADRASGSAKGSAPPVGGARPVAGPAAPGNAAPAAPASPAAGDVVASRATTAAPQPPPAPAAASGALAAGATGAQPDVQIDIRAVADCWIQVRAADQSIVFSRVLKAGETYRVPRPGLILRTGNAGALAIVVDGKPAPPIGALGTLRRDVSLDPDALLAGTAVRG